MVELKQGIVNQEKIGNPTPFMVPRSFAETMQLAQTLAKSDIIPTSFRGRPENVLIAIGMGQEVGLNPFQALQSIYVVNGRPSLWGDAVMGIVRASGQLEYIQESFDQHTFTATCRIKRKGDTVEVTRNFSLEDAKKAGLLAQDKPTWKGYPARMCQMRARSWAIRDVFADYLRGLQIREEMEDIVEGEIAEDLPLRKSEISGSSAVPGAVVTSVPNAEEYISQEDRKALAEFAIDKGWTPEKVKDLLIRRMGIDSSAKLTPGKMAEVKDWLVNGEPPETE